MKRLLIVLLVFASFSLYAEPEGLETLRSTYKDQLTKIGDEEMATLATAQAQYIAALSAIEKQFQQAGKLEPLLKATKEKERFSGDRNLQAADVVLDVPEIASLQKQYASAMKSVPLEPAQKRLNLAGFYERSLKKLEADLTIKGDIQGALAVKAERDGLGNKPEIVQAQNVLAEWNTANASSLPKQPAAEEAPVAKPQPVQDDSNVDKTKIETDVKARVKKFVDAIEDQDWDQAMEFVDPEYVERTGKAITSGILKMKYSRARLVGDNPAAKIRCGDVDVNENGKRVRVMLELWANNRAHTLERMTWIRGETEWYLSFGPEDQQMGPVNGLGNRVPREDRDHRKPPGGWRRK